MWWVLWPVEVCTLIAPTEGPDFKPLHNLTVISNGSTISWWMRTMGLVASRSLYDDCTDWRTTFLTFPHPKLSANTLLELVQSSHLAGFSRYFTVISNGGAISRWIGRMGLVASRSLYDECTDWRTTFLTSPHPQLSANVLFGLVISSHLAGFSRYFTVIFNDGAVSRWMGLVASTYLSPWHRVCTNAIYIWKGSYLNGEPKNVILVLVQKANFAVRACKLPVFMHRRIGPSE